MARTIEIKLTPSSIQSAIKELEAYRDTLDRKKNTLLLKLAEIGLREATVRFTTAMYDAGIKDSYVSLEPIKNGYCIVAQGNSVAFIEFGAGVYYNPSEPYPNPRPSGIVGIGQYGKGYGKRPAWGYRDELGELHVTRGSPAAMPMYHASEEMKKAIKQIFVEVFG